MKYGNSKQKLFLRSFPDVYFDSDNCNHASRSKFNFSYFDCSQEAGQDFCAWSHEQLHKLLQKLVEYGKHPLSYWMTQRVGGGGRKVFEVYGGFPARSDFQHPKHIPKDVRWARFRLEGDMRLVGFIVPSELDGKASKNDAKFEFCANTLYVVFLDATHRFYKTKP
jgi:hypothetical protein